MGKRVFEVARDLGVDHRELLNKCETLNISVRNYMSVLSDGDEAKLRTSVNGGAEVTVEERIHAPGVKRRRTKARSGTGRTVPARSTGAAQPQRRSVPTARRRSVPSVPAPAAEVPQVEPEAPKVEAVPEAPKVEAPTVADAPKVEAPTVADAPKAEPAPEAPKAEAAEAPKAEAAPEAKPAAPAAPEAEAAKPAEGGSDGEPVRAKVLERPSTPQQRPGSSSARVAPPPGRRGPRNSGPVAPGAGVRKPTQSVAGGPGSAKILGSIPLDQLRSRVSRPPARRTGRGRPGTRPGGPGRPGTRPGGGFRPGGRPGFPGAGGPPPAGGPAGDRDRRRRGAAPGAGPTRDNPRRTRSTGGARKRRVFSREDLYKGGQSRVSRGRKRKMSSRKGAKTPLTIPAAHKRVVRVDETISLSELGKAMGVKGNQLLKQLMDMGVTVMSMNHQVDVDTATLLAEGFDYEVKNVAFQEDEVLSGPVEAETIAEDPDAVPRAPVVTIMGHVDHGKTTLLDRIRKARVAEGEAGGITQHIGAYRAKVGDSEVVFLDTPGHAAFTAMRARGAQVTDIVVLIVAADDGIMPQTVESLNHARSAGVPIVVAINKCDRPGVDPERIKQEFTQHELVPEEWGGDTMFVPLSALTGKGVDNLLEALALQAEILELKGNPKKPAFGNVVEARVDKGRGNVATVLVQEGTLQQGNYIVAGEAFGRLRAMIDDTGQRVKTAGPSTPIEVLGLGALPSAGDTFHVVKNERDAKKVIANRSDKARVIREAEAKGPDGLALLAAFGQKPKETQNIIVKCDVAGSLEALKASLLDLATDEVTVKIIHGAVGAVSENDVNLASACDATIMAFSVGADKKARRAADQARVDIFEYSIIYEVLNRVKELMSGLLAPEVIEETLGKAEVRAAFHIQRIGPVAGCFITDGKVQRGAMGRVKRNGSVVIEGKVTTLKRFKDDVREVATGYECGLSVEGYKTIEIGDTIEVYELKEIQRQID